MSRPRFTSVLFAAGAASLCLASAHARPIFMQYEGVDGECMAGSTFSETFVGGVRIVQMHAPTGVGGFVLRPNEAHSGRPMESISINFTKIEFSTPPLGAHVTVADDVIVDGNVITGAVWARWLKLEGAGVQLDFGRSPDADGDIEIVIKNAGVPVARNVCVGDVVGCWVLTALCPELECSIMCPGLCGVPSTGRLDPSGGVAIDLPLANPVTFAIAGHSPVTGDEVGVILRPGRGTPPMQLGGVRIAVGDINGLQINSVEAEFGCPADINHSGALSVQDIFDFLAKYFAGAPEADFNASSSLSVQDLFDFLAAYFAGCD
jgi:hypothetical protein